MSEKTREQKLLEQYEAERKTAEEWEDVEAGGIFSAPGRQTNQIRTAYHEEIVRERENAEHEEHLQQVETWREEKRTEARGGAWRALANTMCLLLLVALVAWLVGQCDAP